jgi:hypothetical protein
MERFVGWLAIISPKSGITTIAAGAFFFVACSPAVTQSNSNPDVSASIEQTSAERQRVQEGWNKAKQDFAQAAALDRFMMQHSSSVEDTKAWALVAETHEDWATLDIDQFTINFDKSCVPTVTGAFDRAGSAMIQYGKDLGTSRDPKALNLSPKLVEYGSDLANLNSICEKMAQQIKDAKEAEKTTSVASSYIPPPAQSNSNDHPYAKAAGEVLGLTLATALVGGLLVLDYAAARSAAAPPVVQTMPMHCTSYQIGMYTDTNCY